MISLSCRINRFELHNVLVNFIISDKNSFLLKNLKAFHIQHYLRVHEAIDIVSEYRKRHTIIISDNSLKSAHHTTCQYRSITVQVP